MLSGITSLGDSGKFTGMRNGFSQSSGNTGTGHYLIQCDIRMRCWDANQNPGQIISTLLKQSIVLEIAKPNVQTITALWIVFSRKRSWGRNHVIQSLTNFDFLMAIKTEAGWFLYL